MLTLNDCLTSDTRIVLIKPEEKKIFRKDFNHAEFVGEGLCIIRNLRCARYFLIGEGNHKINRIVKYGDIKQPNYKIKLGSYDFRNPKYSYFDLTTIQFNIKDFPNRLSQILSMAPNNKNRRELLSEIEELFALDIFMGQEDRIPTNIMFQQNPATGEIHLAPIYDFEYSLKTNFKDYEYCYENALYSMYNKKKIRKFLDEYPEFAEKLAFYLNVDLSEIIKWSYERKGLRVPDDKFYSYKEFEEKRKKLIRAVLQSK